MRALKRARERLVVAYSPLVKYVAGRMSSGLPAHVEEADLISYGLGGLIPAGQTGVAPAGMAESAMTAAATRPPRVASRPRCAYLTM